MLVSRSVQAPQPQHFVTKNLPEMYSLDSNLTRPHSLKEILRRHFCRRVAGCSLIALELTEHILSCRVPEAEAGSGGGHLDVEARTGAEVSLVASRHRYELYQILRSGERGQGENSERKVKQLPGAVRSQKGEVARPCASPKR